MVELRKGKRRKKSFLPVIQSFRFLSNYFTDSGNFFISTYFCGFYNRFFFLFVPVNPFVVHTISSVNDCETIGF